MLLTTIFDFVAVKVGKQFFYKYFGYISDGILQQYTYINDYTDL